MPATATKPAKTKAATNGKPAKSAVQATHHDPSAESAARAREAAALLRQAADPTRLRILLMLDREPLNVGAMCVKLGGFTQPATSHHLALLRHSRLIEPIRKGKENHYHLCPEGRRLVDAVRSLV